MRYMPAKRIYTALQAQCHIVIICTDTYWYTNFCIYSPIKFQWFTCIFKLVFILALYRNVSGHTSPLYTHTVQTVLTMDL